MRPRPRAALIAIGAFVASTAILVRERSGEVGLWDWDTYARLQFIHDYHPETWVDGHLAYHGLMRLLMALGLRDVTAINVETAMAAAAFGLLLRWICRREGLSTGATWLVLVAATLGSPGLVALYLMYEDNVLYLPVVLGVFYLVYQLHPDRRTALARGAVLGVLLAVAMLINISLLVLMFALGSGLVIWWWPGDRVRATGLGVAAATALAVYYLAHVVPFTGAKIALHQFLPAALQLRDFALSRTPLVSLARFAEYRSGLRAIALTPNVHWMELPDWLRMTLLEILPKILFVLAVCLAGWLVRFRRAELRVGLTRRLDLVAVFAIALVFPYLYEPGLIERWDVFWVGCLFALVPFLKTRPSPRAIGLVVAMIAIQGFGTVITVAHHYGLGWASPALVQSRALAEHALDPVVLPYTIDRLILADFVYRAGDRTIYLVREDGELVVFRLDRFVEQRVERAVLEQALRSPTVYVDPWLAPRLSALRP